MSLKVESFADAITGLEALLERRKALHSMPEAIKALRGQLKKLEPLQKAFDVVCETIETSTAKRNREEVAKSETDSSNAYGRDFFPEGGWPDDNSLGAEDHAAKVRNVQAIRDGIAVTITDVSNGESVSSVDPQRAAALRESPWTWEMDLANPRQREAADEANGVAPSSSNFAKQRRR